MSNFHKFLVDEKMIRITENKAGFEISTKPMPKYGENVLHPTSVNRFSVNSRH